MNLFFIRILSILIVLELCSGIRWWRRWSDKIQWGWQTGQKCCTIQNHFVAVRFNHQICVRHLEEVSSLIRCVFLELFYQHNECFLVFSQQNRRNLLRQPNSCKWPENQKEKHHGKLTFEYIFLDWNFHWILSMICRCIKTMKSM